MTTDDQYVQHAQHDLTYAEPLAAAQARRGRKTDLLVALESFFVGVPLAPTFA